MVFAPLACFGPLFHLFEEEAMEAVFAGHLGVEGRADEGALADEDRVAAGFRQDFNLRAGASHHGRTGTASAPACSAARRCSGTSPCRARTPTRGFTIRAGPAAPSRRSGGRRGRPLARPAPARSRPGTSGPRSAPPRPRPPWRAPSD